MHQYGYRQGYRDGYAKGRHEGRENDPTDYQSPGWRQATRGGDIYDQSGYGYGSNIGYRNGYQDGTSQAREDEYQNKPFNPKPRGKYDDRDHGYSREYGDRTSYKAQYTNGYQAGYQSAFRQ